MKDVKIILSKLFSIICSFILLVSMESCFISDSSDDDWRREERERVAKLLEVDLSYKTACRELDFLKAHEVLDKIQDQCLTIKRSFLNRENVAIIESKYFQAVDYVYGQEIIYLFNSGESNVDQRIFMLMTEFPFIGKCPVEGLQPKYLTEHEVEFYELIAYQKSVESFHKACNKVLDYTIEQGNKKMASKILKLYKAYPKLIENNSGEKCVIEGIKFDDGYQSGIKYDNSAYQEAQKRYNSAF